MTTKTSDTHETKPIVYDTLLATVPSPKGSIRCGKGSCGHYDKHNKISGCKLFDDRRKCIRSNKQRKKSANTSKRRGNTANWYCC